MLRQRWLVGEWLKKPWVSAQLAIQFSIVLGRMRGAMPLRADSGRLCRIGAAAGHCL